MVSRSHDHTGGPIKLKHSVDRVLNESVESSIALRFRFPGQYKFTLNFKENNTVQWLTDIRSVFETDEKGVAEIELSFIPNRAGKLYLKFVARAIEDPNIARPFAIPVFVADEEGEVPRAEKPRRKRINLPAY